MSAVSQISLFKPVIEPGIATGTEAGTAASLGSATAVGQADFGTMVSEMANNTVDSLKNAEAASIKGIQGEASAHDVASAVMEAEQSLRMAISVRDKVVQAYLEISRMQI